MSLSHFLEVNLASFPPKFFFQKNKKKFKSVSNGLFSVLQSFEKIDTEASNRGVVNNFEI